MDCTVIAHEKTAAVFACADHIQSAGKRNRFGLGNHSRNSGTVRWAPPEIFFYEIK